MKRRPYRGRASQEHARWCRILRSFVGGHDRHRLPYLAACFDTLPPKYSALLTIRSCSSMGRLPSIRRSAATHAARPLDSRHVPSLTAFANTLRKNGCTMRLVMV
jgi:hypothetical protein